MRETEIIGQFFARDEAALTSVQSEYGAYCSTIARNILWDKEDVEECLNDTWLKAWNTIPPKRPQSLLAYLGRVTRNGALNMVRDQNRQKRAGDQYTTSLDEIGELSGAVHGQPELRFAKQAGCQTAEIKIQRFEECRVQREKKKLGKKSMME